MKITNLKFMV